MIFWRISFDSGSRKLDTELGYLVLDQSLNAQYVCDDNGKIEKIVPRTRNEAHKLIEEAMLAANV